MNKLITERGAIKYKIKFDDNEPHLNYEIIQAALNIDGLSTNDNTSDSAANAEFIKLMKRINKYSPMPKKPINNESEAMVKRKILNPEIPIDHDIKQYTKLYHPTKVQMDEKKPLKQRLHKLKQLCQTMPFERTTSQIENIFRILKTISTLSHQVDDEMLKLLSNIIIYECINEPGLTLFGNKAFYILLSGSIRPMTTPWVKFIGEPTERFTQNLQPNEICPNLCPGECFGTLDEIILEDMDCSKLLLSEVVEPCELIFITTSYYRRILEKYNSQKHCNKLLLLKGQEAFTVWPHQALVKIANIFSWSIIPANTMVCKEGEISPIIAFIQEGSCHVLRKLKVKETLSNGKEIIKTKQVIIGNLGKNKSLGEISLLDQTPMMHSLMAKENIRVIQADKEKLESLDLDVKLLLRQSCSLEYHHITQENVEDIYIKQKSKKNWTNFKESVIAEVMDPGRIRSKGSN